MYWVSMESASCKYKTLMEEKHKQDIYKKKKEREFRDVFIILGYSECPPLGGKGNLC